MLSENIRNIRKSKGYSQEELAIRLHVTRQTISKWEKGISVPDADLLSDMADVFEVSVSELLGEPQIEKQNQDAVIEQLSRINEQMAVRNRRTARILKVILGTILAIVIVIVTITIMGSRLTFMPTAILSDHLGKLTYSMPDDSFSHDKDDVGVTVEDGKERISAKIYKCYDDMTELTIWEYDYDTELIKEFKENHKDTLIDWSNTHGSLPDIVEEIVAATDETDEVMGTFYAAFVVVDGTMYKVSALNGTDPLWAGESLISSMQLDDTMKDEYRN